jgi:hypothetical protein
VGLRCEHWGGQDFLSIEKASYTTASLRRIETAEAAGNRFAPPCQA